MSLVLSTQRLVLRRLQVSDALAVLAYRSDPIVSKYQLWHPQNLSAVADFIEQLLYVEFGTAGTWYQLAVTLRESNVVIGDCGLHFPVGKADEVQIGLTLAPAYQGMGFATEALEAVLQYLFGQEDKRRVCGRADVRNQASLRMMARVGMREEQKGRKKVLVRGEWAEEVVYGICREEWESQRKVSRETW